MRSILQLFSCICTALSTELHFINANTRGRSQSCLLFRVSLLDSEGEACIGSRSALYLYRFPFSIHTSKSIVEEFGCVVSRCNIDFLRLLGVIHATTTVSSCWALLIYMNVLTFERDVSLSASHGRKHGHFPCFYL